MPEQQSSIWDILTKIGDAIGVTGPSVLDRMKEANAYDAASKIYTAGLPDEEVAYIREKLKNPHDRDIAMELGSMLGHIVRLKPDFYGPQYTKPVLDAREKLATNQEGYEKYGIFPRPTGEIVRELDSSQMQIDPDMFFNLPEGTPIPLEDVIQYRDFYEAVPEAKDYTIQIEDMPDSHGSFNPVHKLMRLSTNRLTDQTPEGQQLMRGTIAHELQHLVQHEQGLMGQGSSRYLGDQFLKSQLGGYTVQVARALQDTNRAGNLSDTELADRLDRLFKEVTWMGGDPFMVGTWIDLGKERAAKYPVSGQELKELQDRSMALAKKLRSYKHKGLSVYMSELGELEANEVKLRDMMRTTPIGREAVRLNMPSYKGLMDIVAAGDPYPTYSYEGKGTQFLDFQKYLDQYAPDANPRGKP